MAGALLCGRKQSDRRGPSTEKLLLYLVRIEFHSRFTIDHRPCDYLWGSTVQVVLEELYK